MNHDVAVVGAGLAGLQCARLLAARGLRIILIDCKPSLTEGIHTTGIFVRKTWEDFPLPDEQLGRGLRNVTLYSPSRRAMHLKADHDEFRVGRMSWIYLYLLEQCGRAGVSWLPGSRVISVEPLTVERNGRRELISARYIIGADGARSTVAQQLGLDRNTEFLVGVEDVIASRGGEPALHCFLDPRIAPGYIAWLVDDGGEAHVGVAGYRDRFNPALALQQFRESLGIRETAVEHRGGLIPVNGMLRRIANRKGLLIGDAAGAVSPLTAGGLDAAVRLSTFAADVVTSWFETNDPATLAQYNGERFRARFITRQWMRRAMRAIEHPLLMELACAALRLSPMRALAEHVFFARGGSFPDVRLELRTSSSAP